MYFTMAKLPCQGKYSKIYGFFKISAFRKTALNSWEKMGGRPLFQELFLKRLFQNFSFWNSL
jgi:hypothetical protein